ncbi:MAG: hypothetical protein ACHBN1_00515 [Heteroscytonema crispum UTEX LB 1556]
MGRWEAKSPLTCGVGRKWGRRVWGLGRSVWETRRRWGDKGDGSGATGMEDKEQQNYEC